MSRPNSLWFRLGALGGAALLCTGLSGCSSGSSSSSDGCQGRKETCLSLTLSGAEGIMLVDRLEVMVLRQPKPQQPAVPLSMPFALPFRVAVLWPDGPGTLSVRSYLQGQLNGVTPELGLDLRNGAHDMRKLTLFPPLVNSSLGDLGYAPRRDMAMPKDMAMQPPDLAMSPDLAMPPAPDLAAAPDDMTTPLDQTSATD